MTDSSRLNFLKTITSTSSEADVEHKVITPMLRLLGYQDSDWRAQFGAGKSKIDFLIHPKELAWIMPPYLVIEVKAPSKSIGSNCWQIYEYMRRTRAILGLLTNGYRFRLLYRYENQIATIAEYSQSDLASNFKLFYGLLCKKTCLKFGNAISQSQQRLNLKFLALISDEFHSEDGLNLLKKHQSSSNNSVVQVTSKVEVNQRKNGMIITVFNNKGGVGKTTMTVNLAATLNLLGKRVLLIDIDPQANLTTGLGIDPLKDVEEEGRKDITDLLENPRVTLEQVMMKRRWDNVQLDVVPSHIRLGDMEPTLMTRPDIDRVLKKKLKNYVTEYDYILIDPPPSFGKVNSIALMASSGVLIPTQLSPYPIRALEYVVDRAIGIDQSRDDEPLAILGITVSMYNRAAMKVARNMTDEVFKVLAKKPESKNVTLFPENTWIPNLSVVSLITGKGYPISSAEHDDELEQREKEAAQDAFNCYVNLAKHFIKVTGGE